MTLKLDHVFILVEPGAQVVDRLLELGFQEGPRNTHPGQGTANRRIYFAKGMLEFIWVQDADEARNGSGRSLYFAERAEDPTASPFGMIFVPGEIVISTPSTDTEGVLALAAQADRLSVRSRQEHLMEITLNDHQSGRTEDYRPAMPLILRW